MGGSRFQGLAGVKAEEEEEEGERVRGKSLLLLLLQVTFINLDPIYPPQPPQPPQTPPPPELFIHNIFNLPLEQKSAKRPYMRILK